ncbi:MAG: glycosyltransferase family 39 protein [bacterium]|nr:glycosyltransferase family 39 protein [bacterium]
MRQRSDWPFLLLIVGLAAGLQAYGLDKIVLGSDELHPARALISSDWSILRYPWPAEATLEFYRNWPMHFPPLFALLTRAAVVVLGASHFAFRLLPLLFASAATLVSYFLYREYSGRRWALIAPVLVGLASDQMLTWAKAIKHYTADVLFCSLLLIAGKRLLEGNQTRDWALFGLLAAVSFWIGYGAVYVTASIFLLLCVRVWLLARRNQGALRPHFVPLLLTGLLTVVSFAGLRSLAIEQAVSNDVFMKSFGIQMLDHSRIGDIGYVAHFFARIGFQTLKLPWFFFRHSAPFAVVANALLAIWLISRVRRRQWYELGLLVLPWLFCVGAAVAGFYPFTANRLLLFLLPSWMRMMIGGFSEAVDWLRQRGRLLAAAVMVVLGVWVAGMVYRNAVDVSKMRLGGGRRIDLAVQYLAQNAEDGDTVFLHWAAIVGFYYYFTDHQPGYAHEYPIPGKGGKVHVIYGEQHNKLEDYEPLFRKLEAVPGRLWLLFGHKWPSVEMTALEARLRAQRPLLREYEGGKCRVVLFGPNGELRPTEEAVQARER